MKNNCNILLLFLLSCIALLTGCGKKYAQPFHDKLTEQLTSQYPFKIEKLDIVEVSSTAKGAIFKYKAKVTTTEDLYENVPGIDLKPAENAMQKLGAYCQNCIQNNAAEMKELNQLNSDSLVALNNKVNQMKPDYEKLNQTSQTPVKKIVTTSGTIIKIDGEGKAHLNDYGVWEFTDVTQRIDAAFQGEKLGNQRLILDGSKEAKDFFSNAINQRADFIKNIHDIIKQFDDTLKEEKDKVALENKKKSNENKAIIEAFLADFKPGTKYMGQWQAGNSQGEIGIQFVSQQRTPDGFASLNGILFDPANPHNQKPFDGKFTGDGTESKPFVLHLAVHPHVRGISTGGKMDGYISGEVARQLEKDFQNKTEGFLLDVCNYSFVLTYSNSNKSMLGRIESHADYSPFITDAKDLGFQFSQTYQANNAPPIKLSKDFEPKPEGATPGNDSTQMSNPDTTKPNVPQEGNGNNAGAGIGYPGDIVNIGGRTLILTGKAVSPEHYRLSAAEVKGQIELSNEYLKKLNAEAVGQQLQEARDTMSELKTKYPECPTTLFWEMKFAFIDKDIPTAKKIFLTIINEYPLPDALKRIVVHTYQLGMQHKAPLSS